MPDGSQLRLHAQTRDALRSAPETVIVVPLGATEQHGPHLPVGTDWLIVEDLALGAAEIAARETPVLVTPVLPFGSSAHHLPFGGTMSLGSDTYLRALGDLLDSVVVSGFGRIFVLNGHGGNHELMQVAVRDLAVRHAVSAAAASYWTIAWDALVDAGAALAGGLPGHAGAFETSLMLALHPELVSTARPHRDGVEPSDPRGFARSVRTEHHGAWGWIDGYTDSPDEATAETGRRYLDAILPAVAASFVTFGRAASDTGH
jgi:creatinine amidohydrolase